MAQTGNVYANAVAQAFSANINWLSDSIKLALLTAYTPNLATHVHWSDVLANGTEVSSSGTGYTTGGQALTSKTLTVTAANSWATAWQASTVYAAGTIVIPTSPNGYLYQAETAGTSGASAPTWPTVVGETVTDSGVIWTNLGESITEFGSAAVTWSSSTITAAYGVIYDSTPATQATQPLIALLNFGGNQSSSSGPFTLTPSTYGWFILNPA